MGLETKQGYVSKSFLYIVSVLHYLLSELNIFLKVSGRENMMAEIKRGGPIACSIGCTPEFDYNYTGGVCKQKSTQEVRNF